MEINHELHNSLAEWDKQWVSLSPGAGPAERRAQIMKLISIATRANKVGFGHYLRNRIG